MTQNTTPQIKDLSEEQVSEEQVSEMLDATIALYNQAHNSQYWLHDRVLISLHGQTTRTEAIIVGLCDNSIQIIEKDRDPIWVDKECVTDNLGTASPSKLEEFGLKPIVSTQYTTGTYVLDCEVGALLVEIDKANDNYYIRQVTGRKNVPLCQDHINRLHSFSDPDKGNYEVDPGVYISPLLETIEVIPYNGVNYYRHMDSSCLFRLNKPKAKSLTRIESDTLDVNAVMIVDKSELETPPSIDCDGRCEKESKDEIQLEQELEGSCHQV